MNYLNLLTLSVNILFLTAFIIYEIKVIINPQKYITYSNNLIDDISNNKKLSSKQNLTLTFHFIYFCWVIFGLITSSYWILYFGLFASSIIKSLSKVKPSKKFRMDAIFSILILILITIYEIKEVIL